MVKREKGREDRETVKEEKMRCFEEIKGKKEERKR